jgi:hypothetical protein
VPELRLGTEFIHEKDHELEKSIPFSTSWPSYEPITLVRDIAECRTRRPPWRAGMGHAVKIKLR